MRTINRSLIKESIEELENVLYKIVNSFTPQTLKRLIFYPYIKEDFLG